ncbi:MAG: tetratricopeptide repeat protein [Pseudomonadota bacterium]
MNDVSRLEQAGDVTSALAASRHLALQVPDRAEAARLAIDVALRANRRQAADTLVKTLRAKSSNSLAAAYAATYVHFRRDRVTAARKAAADLIERFPTNLRGAQLLAEIATAQDDWAGAIDVLKAVLQHHRQDARIHQQLAGLCWRTGEFEEVVTFARQAKDLGLDAAANTRLLGAALSQLNRHDEAVDVLREAHAVDPDHFETLALLSVARVGMADVDGAMADVERALDLQPFSIRETPSADGQRPFTVLALENGSPALYVRSDFANYHLQNFISYLASPGLRIAHTPVTSNSVSRLAASELHPDVIVNNVVVGEIFDDAVLQHHRNIMELYGDVPVVNPPEAVIHCERVENSRRFEGESGFIFPKTRHVNLDVMAFDDVLTLVETEFDWPILLRPPYTDEGIGMSLVDNADSLREQIEAIELKNCLIIQYHECRSLEGVGHQYRGLVIGDIAYVDRVNSFLDFQSHDNLRREAVWQKRGFDKIEQAFLADPDSALGFDYKTVFAPIIERTPLDIFGFDFSITRDGRPIVFEVNASMNLFNKANAAWSPYLQDHYQFLNDVVVDYLRSRANAASTD